MTARSRGPVGPFGALRDGAIRVSRAPAVLAGVWVVTLAVAVPSALWIRSAIAADLGDSAAAVRAAEGVNWDWWQEFGERRPEAAETFQPSILGFAVVLGNVSRVLEADAPAAAILPGLATYVVLWTFFAGGILDRYARQRRTGAHGFFAASGVFFFRFLRLAVLAAAAYAFAFAVIHPLLFDRFYEWATRGLAVERTAFLVRVACYLVFGAVLAANVVLFDYARVRAVVEDRRSMIGALVAAARFVRRNAGTVAGLYLLVLGLLLGVFALYGAVAPGVGTGSPLSLVIVFLAGQLLIAGRLAVRLTGYAAAVALFQDRLGHRSYVAVPELVWPDSPEVESLAKGPAAGPAQPARQRID